MDVPPAPPPPHAAAQRSLKMYNNLVERCFRECADDMRSKSLSSKEEQVRRRAGGRAGHAPGCFMSAQHAGASHARAGLFRARASQQTRTTPHTTHVQCVVKCCEKFMNVTGRVGMRFSEFFTQMEAAAQQHMAEMAKQQGAR